MSDNSFHNATYISFTTFRKTGVAVPTPVWFASDAKQQQHYIFTAANSGKVKRLRNSSQAEVAPCTVRGKVTGITTAATAELITDEKEIQYALDVLQKKYGWQMTFTNIMSRLSGKYQQRAYIRFTTA